jgi:hypothetical protein
MMNDARLKRWLITGTVLCPRSVPSTKRFIRSTIAQRIIAFAKAGERDPERLSDLTLADLRAAPPQV